MKKYIKTILIITVLALLGVGYFWYLSNKEPSTQTVENENNNRELEALLTRDIDNGYPQSPKEVVKLYSRITEAYYKTKLTEDQINTLGRQARKLFDEELLGTQTEEEFLAALKKDIEEYNNLNRYVSDYKVDESENVEYKTFDERKYASLNAVYMIRQGSALANSNTKYMLRQDGEGRWKILYWELDRAANSETSTQ
ncbi:MAG: hypothetical protein IJB96_01330 [Lachnospira sp.]|nr:hypothetical protein [Lachnospira sp.]